VTDETEVSDLLEERPDLEPALSAVLEVDDRLDEWTFDDVPVDSGAFGELVSCGVVERYDDEYRVADPASVRVALDGDSTTAPRGDRQGGIVEEALARPSEEYDLHLRPVAALTAALVVVAAFRLTTWLAVFREGDVVSPANDPYFYRYWFERVAAEGVTLAELPRPVANGEPLLVTLLASVTSLLGGGEWAAGTVAAWYPVVAAVLTGGFVYLFATELTHDRRVALASVLLLAVLPAHALRTALAFADHHALDYLLLMVTATSTLTLARRGPEDALLDRRTLLGGGGVAVGVAGHVLAWDNGPLLLLPLVVYVPLAVLSAVRRGASPLSEIGPLLVGIGGGAVVAGAMHLGLGWQTSIVGFAPAALFVGAVSVTGVGEAIRRIDLPVDDELAVAGTVLGGGAVSVAAVLALTDTAETVAARADVLFVDAGIGETASLFASGPSGFGWLILLGPILFVGTVVLAWATVRAARGSPRWLVPVAYGWVFLLLAVFQKRFAGELAPFIATFAGLGVITIAWKVELARPPVPLEDREADPFDLPQPRVETAPHACAGVPAGRRARCHPDSHRHEQRHVHRGRLRDGYVRLRVRGGTRAGLPRELRPLEVGEQPDVQLLRERELGVLHLREGAVRTVPPTPGPRGLVRTVRGPSRVRRHRTRPLRGVSTARGPSRRGVRESTRERGWSRSLPAHLRA
jgi:dolichyl-diphosphooligosaccharide--protein glycosyltransferase